MKSLFVGYLSLNLLELKLNLQYGHFRGCQFLGFGYDLVFYLGIQQGYLLVGIGTESILLFGDGCLLIHGFQSLELIKPSFCLCLGIYLNFGFCDLNQVCFLNNLKIIQHYHLINAVLKKNHSSYDH